MNRPQPRLPRQLPFLRDFPSALLSGCLVLFVGVVTPACGGDDTDSDGGTGIDGGGGIDGSADGRSDGRSDGLTSTDGGTNLGEGEACTLTAQCAEGLHCSDMGVCAPSGTGTVGDACDSDATCERGLVCVRMGLSFSCLEAGDKGVGERCLSRAACQAGLECTDGFCVEGRRMQTDAGLDVVDPCEGVDCNDGDSCTVDQCVSGRCENNQLDEDEDGYGSTIVPGCGRDCSDADPTVNPDQMMFMGERHGGNPPLQAGTYDWNCNGTEEPEYPVINCDRDITCDPGTGFSSAVPCGMTGTLTRCDSGCRRVTVMAGVLQRCR